MLVVMVFNLFICLFFFNPLVYLFSPYIFQLHCGYGGHLVFPLQIIVHVAGVPECELLSICTCNILTSLSLR